MRGSGGRRREDRFTPRPQNHQNPAGRFSGRGGASLLIQLIPLMGRGGDGALRLSPIAHDHGSRPRVALLSALDWLSDNAASLRLWQKGIGWMRFAITIFTFTFGVLGFLAVFVHPTYAQGVPATDTDLAASYCIRVAIRYDEEYRAIMPTGCETLTAQFRSECLRGERDSQSHIQRLQSYLTVRMYSVGRSESWIAGIRAARLRAEQDLNQCRDDHLTRCGYCSRSRSENISACFKNCREQIPACVRLKRCEAGSFLGAVP